MGKTVRNSIIILVGALLLFLVIDTHDKMEAEHSADPYYGLSCNQINDRYPGSEEAHNCVVRAIQRVEDNERRNYEYNVGR